MDGCFESRDEGPMLGTQSFWQPAPELSEEAADAIDLAHPLATIWSNEAVELAGTQSEAAGVDRARRRNYTNRGSHPGRSPFDSAMNPREEAQIGGTIGPARRRGGEASRVREEDARRFGQLPPDREPMVEVVTDMNPAIATHTERVVREDLGPNG
jgi:hypothetical protein